MKQVLLFSGTCFTNGVLLAQERATNMQHPKDALTDSILNSPWLWLAIIAFFMFFLSFIDRIINHRKF